MSSEHSNNEDVEMAEEEPVVEFKPYSHATLLVVKSSQNQNGLRHNDYTRYHQYCVRKIHRLRKVVKYMQQSGNKKGQTQEFVKKMVSPEDAKGGEKFIEILIYKMESEWAYGMDMKKAISIQDGQREKEESKAGLKAEQSQFKTKNPNANRNAARLKIHARKRFQRVYVTGEQLLKVSEECLDLFTKYEMRAYVEGMQAAFLIEMKKWQEALDKLQSSKAIYQKIMQYKDSIESVLYQEKVGELDTFIRLCCTNLKMKSAQAAEKKFEETKKQIQSQVETSYKDTKTEQIENIEQISVGNKQIPLKSERLRDTFKKIETQANLIQNSEKQINISDSSTDSQNKIGDLIKHYLKYVDVIDEAQITIKKEKTEESKKSEQSGSIYNILIQYTQRLKIKASIDRNLLQARQLSNKFYAVELFKPKFEQSDQTMVRAQNIIRFYEKAIKSQKQLMNIEKDMHSTGGEQSSMDPLAIIQNEFQEKYQLIFISYFGALHFIQEQSNQGTKQAMVILQSCVYKIEEAIEFVQTNGLKSAKIQSMINELQNDILGKVKFALCKSLSKHLTNKGAAKNVEQQQITDKKKVDGNDKMNSKKVQFDNVFDQVFNTDSMKPKGFTNQKVQIKDAQSEKAELNFLGNENLNIMPQDQQNQDDFDISKIKLSKQYKLINPLPNLKSVPATPQFFDIAGGYVSYAQNGVDPAVESAKYQIAGGISGYIGSWFGGSK